MPKESEKKYRVQRYRKDWGKKEWAGGWLSASKNLNGKAFCYVCNKDLVAGKSELIGHTKSSQHARNMKTVQTNQPVSNFVQVASFPQIKAELNAVALIARRNLSFSFLDHLTKTVHFVADDSKVIRGMTCNRPEGTCLLNECLAVFLHEKLLHDIQNARGISILFDKATDIAINKMFCVRVRYFSQEVAAPITRLYRLIPVHNGDAESLFQSLQEALSKDGIAWNNLIGLAQMERI